ncbi:MAG: F0F1 ATP synthase subunit delta [Candidatus Daviesbacteria bacterium]|nr:F0F1 ATP synthase subunit delta [Candidatus Daviesbacteria bacterium]
MKKNKDLKKLVEICCRSCFHEGRINEKKALSILKDLKSLPRSQAIFAVSEFLKGLKKRQDQATLVIESSVPLSKPQYRSIVKKMKKEFLINEAKNIVNPEILGGFKIKIGDTVLDYSLSNKISQVREAISHQI